MRRIIIIGEGRTEQSFCKDILEPHFLQHGSYIANPTISKSGGGIVAWQHLKADIERFLKSPGVFVTTFIDYYGIQDRHAFPEWAESKAIPDRAQRMAHLEAAMAADISPDLGYRFIPYIQLHKFEGLLFSDIAALERSFTPAEFADRQYLDETINSFSNPEDINDSTATAPSKRLERIIGPYNSKPSTKSLWGPLIAQEIGLQKIRSRCPRFNGWVSKLESL